MGVITVSLTEFEAQSKEWQREYVSIAMLHKLLQRRIPRDAFAEEVGRMREMAIKPAKQLAANGQWI
jgi:hypothetical protein